MATGRYLDTRQFQSLLADLRLTRTSAQAGLLEFLERQGMVTPAARIFWPRALVLEGREVASDPTPTPEEREWTDALEKALRAWSRHDAPPDLIHPLDDPDLGPARGLIRQGEVPFEPWETFRTNIRPEGETPLYVHDAVDTFYHDWQALIVADALRCGVRLIFDTRRPELLEVAMRGDFADLPERSSYVQTSFEAPRGLRDGHTWAPFFDAAARLDVARERQLIAISMAHGGQPGPMTESDTQALTATLSVAAKAALAPLVADWPKLKSFVVYLCERWDEFTRRGESAMANEYRRQIQRAVRLAVAGLDIETAFIITDVGRVTGHFDDTLNVIFPDLEDEARDAVLRSLLHVIVPAAPATSPDLTVDEAASVDLVDWLERTDQWKVHIAIQQILQHQFQGDTLDHAGLAKEVESLGTTFEHCVDSLLAEAGLSASGTLCPKVQRLWKNVPDVVDDYWANKGLTNTIKAARATQIAAIDSLALASPNAGVTRVLLKGVLYRNEGTHGGMKDWDEAEIHEASRASLLAMLLCRKAFVTRPPTP
ncbi:hypothetical protein ACETK8_10005 [Brevundimonas staleyi]|uniref:TIGR02391 family protein n=1 Tax=Brevundimonas staleyi TaxID=74326 RepID=A0ABW0FQ78_9CAUL